MRSDLLEKEERNKTKLGAGAGALNLVLHPLALAVMKSCYFSMMMNKCLYKSLLFRCIKNGHNEISKKKLAIVRAVYVQVAGRSSVRLCVLVRKTEKPAPQTPSKQILAHSWTNTYESLNLPRDGHHPCCLSASRHIKLINPRPPSCWPIENTEISSQILQIDR
jgi:hypothetical protein